MPGQAVKTNAGQIARRYGRRARALEAGIVDATRQATEDARKVAVAYSSGRAYNPKRDKARPYARRNPHPPLPPFMINVQSGAFRAGWRVRAQKNRNGAVGTLWNTERRPFGPNPTRFMVARDILGAVLKAAGPNYRKRMRQEVRNALSKR